MNRIYRYGQKKTCVVYRLVDDIGMDRKIHARQVQKTGTSREIVDNTPVQSQFSDEELHQLYSLGNVNAVENIPRTSLPCESLLAKIVERFPQLIIKWEDHESFFSPVLRDELSNTEKETTWKNYQKLIVRDSGPKKATVYKQHISYGPTEKKFHLKNHLTCIRCPN